VLWPIPTLVRLNARWEVKRAYFSQVIDALTVPFHLPEHAAMLYLVHVAALIWHCRVEEYDCLLASLFGVESFRHRSMPRFFTVPGVRIGHYLLNSIAILVLLAASTLG